MVQKLMYCTTKILQPKSWLSLPLQEANKNNYPLQKIRRKRLSWPSLSTDLNCIKTLWPELKSEVQMHKGIEKELEMSPRRFFLDRTYKETLCKGLLEPLKRTLRGNKRWLCVLSCIFGHYVFILAWKWVRKMNSPVSQMLFLYSVTNTNWHHISRWLYSLCWRWKIFPLACDKYGN